MTNYFLDSSALVKRYLAESGSNWIRVLASPPAANILLVAQVTQAEMVSAVSRRKRENAITPQSARAMRQLIDRHMAHEYAVIRLSDQIVQIAEDLLENHPLRAYDAIQLATAAEIDKRLQTRGRSPVVFLSADQRLLAAAGLLGLVTDNPDNHP